MPIAKSILIGLVVTLCADAFPQLSGLTDTQIDEAIALGKNGDVAVPLVGRFLGISKGDFDVYIEGPIARIAGTAHDAFKQLRPFTRADVTDAMKEPVYRVIVRRTKSADLVFVQHVVLMPKGSKALEDAIQPIRESNGNDDAYFDRFPPGEFDVVVATDHGPQRYNVTSKDRIKIR